METNVTEERLHAHALLDILPAEKVNEVLSLLEEMVPETHMSLADRLAQAAIEDEEITPEMAARLDRARASAERGESVPHEEILREFGLH
jgi:predicted transcriptional regulator